MPSTAPRRPMNPAQKLSRVSEPIDWRAALRSSVPVLAGVGALLAVWWLAAEIFASLRVIPSPPAVFRQMLADRGSYSANGATTLREAFVGFCWGNAFALVLGGLFVL